MHQRLDGTGFDSKDVEILIESTRTRHFLKRKPAYALLEVVLKYLDVLQERGLPSDKTIQTQGSVMSSKRAKQENGEK